MKTMRISWHAAAMVLALGTTFGPLLAVLCAVAAAEDPSRNAGGPAIVPGLVGQAFLIDSAEREFTFRTRDTFNPAQGTVEFWVQPQREIGAEDFEGVLYRTIDPVSTTQGLQVIFCGRGILVNSKSASGWDLHRVFPVRFAARSWHHVALTWNDSTCGFYIDGSRLDECPMKALTGCSPRTYVGAMGGRYLSMSAIDELRISNTPLSAEEIRRDFDAGQKHQPLTQVPGRTLFLQHCDALSRVTRHSLTAQFDVRPDSDKRLSVAGDAVDALGPTDWFQGQWPSDASIPEPQYPRFRVAPISAREPGITLTKIFPLDGDLGDPVATFSVETDNGVVPLYSGAESARIVYRVGNLLRLVDPSPPLQRTVEMIVVSHRQILLRIRLFGAAKSKIHLDLQWERDNAESEGHREGDLWVTPGGLGPCGFEFRPGCTPGETLVTAVYDASCLEQLRLEVQQARGQAARFDALWQELARPHAVEPFLIGNETAAQRDAVAALVNRVLRNARAGGDIRAPSLLEFFGPAWPNADGVSICFQPACRYTLWIEPSWWANSLRTLLDQQTPEGMVPQAVMRAGGIRDKTQIPNISPVLRDYYTFTGDREFLEYAYPRFKRWYAWLLANRDPTHEGIISMGDAKMSLYDSLCEYRDNSTTPTQPSFLDTCNPVTRTAEIGGRPEKVFLPDIVACQARMAEDLAFLAGELGRNDDTAYFTAEYHRVRDWANRILWDEPTQFYYPVVRATGEKVMKRSVTSFWLLWAGVPDKTRKDFLVAAMFDPKQFFTTIPLPQIALNDPSFNPKCGHWGDGYCWPMDGISAFDGLLRYEEWDRAAQLATQYDRGIFAAIEKSHQPNEYYHHSGRPAGCEEMGTAGCLPLVFRRYLRDYHAGNAPAQWLRFAPVPLR